MTMSTQLRRRFAEARGDAGGDRTGEDGIALMLALMVIFIAGTLSIVVGASVVGQVKPSQSERKLTRTVSASEAGFDAALNRIRAATKVVGAATVGDFTKLPCGPITGQVSSNAGSLTYSVAIAYFSRKPLVGANQIGCSAAGTTGVPAFATLTSIGAGTDVPRTAAGAGNRRLSTVYDFKTTNANVAGGLVHLHDQETPLCLEVGAGGNPAGKDDELHLATCDDNRPGQSWSYTPDLLLQVAGTNLCLQAESASNGHIYLNDCQPTLRQQRWSFNDIGRFEGAAESGDTSGWCFTSVDTPGRDGSRMVMEQQCSGGYDYVHTLSPEARVGAGAAGEALGNLVNYRYFGRCLDVTNQNVNVGWLIGYPCKQKPDPKFLTWNQVFSYDAVTGQYVTKPSTDPLATRYCLQAGSNSAPPTSMTRVLTKPCTTGEAFQQWTRTGVTESYASSYNITTNGLCLTLGAAPPEADAYYRQWGMAIVQTCNGSLEQKWNAPPTTVDAQLDNTREGAGG